MGFNRIIVGLISVVQMSCSGLANQSGAIVVDPSTATALTSTTTDCHFKEYQEKIAPYVLSQCTACHAGSSGGLLLAAGTAGTVDQPNYAALLVRVATTVTSADQTLLMKKITQGSGTSHAFQRSASDPIIADYANFVQNLISDPSCAAPTPTAGSGSTGSGTGTGTGNSGTCTDASCFF